MNKHDIKLQELARNLVDREVYYCVSSLVSTLVECAQLGCSDLDQDELMDICQQDDWETPATYFILNDADFDDLENIADKYGYWSDTIEETGIKSSIPAGTHNLCTDCHLLLQTGELYDVSNERLEEVEECVESLPEEFQPTGEENEFSAYRCDCCGTNLAGARYEYTDFSDEETDIKTILERTEGGDRLEYELRQKILNLVEAEPDGWREVCEEYNLDPEIREAYEHWIVSEWAARWLEEKGEITGEVCGLTIWGRCCTGQSIYMDNVWQEKAAEIWPEQLEGLE